jgi:hypothetical protein
VPDVVRIGRAKIKVFVEKALRGVGMRVDYESGVVKGARPRRNHYVSRFRRRSRRLRRKKEQRGKQSRNREQKSPESSHKKFAVVPGKPPIV